MRRAEVPEQRVDAPWGCRCGATNCKGARQCEAPGGVLLGAVSESSRNLPGTFLQAPGCGTWFCLGCGKLGHQIAYCKSN